jgi:hypothetical protein
VSRDGTPLRGTDEVLMNSPQNRQSAPPATRIVIDRFGEALNRHDAVDAFTVHDGKVAAKLRT